MKFPRALRFALPGPRRRRVLPVVQRLVALALATICASCELIDLTHLADESSLLVARGWTRVSGPLGAEVLVPPHEDATGITIDLAPTPADRDFVVTGPTFVIGPAGRTFRTPVVVSLPLQATGRNPRTSVYTREADGPWTELRGTSTPGSNRVSARVRHFSPFVPGVPSGAGGAAGNVDGTWVGQLDFTNHPRTFTLQLQRTNDGDVLGYVVGGTSKRTVVTGSVAADVLNLRLELLDPLGGHTVDLTATIAGTSLTGGVVATQRNSITGTSTTRTYPVQFTASSDVFRERRFVLAKGMSLASVSSPVDVAVVTSVNGGSGATGGFVGRQDCNLFACAGGVTAFGETPTSLTFGLESGGGCPGSGSVALTSLDSSTGVYSGSFTYTDCNGTTNGPALGARWTGARTDDAAEVLADFARIADDLESGTTFSAFLPPNQYPPLAPTYFHNGSDYAGTLAALDAEVASHGSIDVKFGAFRNLTTDTAGASSILGPASYGVDYRDVRSAVPIGGGPSSVYRDDSSRPGTDELRALGLSLGRWVFVGNQHDSIGLPYSIADFAPHAMSTVVWPFGVHGGGHPEGHGGFDIDLASDVNVGRPVVAATDSTVISVESDPIFPGQYLIGTDAHGFGVHYAHVLAPVVSPGDLLSTGDPIGESVPWHGVHFEIRASSGESACAYPVLNATARAAILAESLLASYPEELTEPFLCNDIARTTFPMRTVWRKRTSGPGPAQVRFVRASATSTDYTFDWLDASGNVLRSGTVGGPNLFGTPQSLDFVAAGYATEHAAYRIDNVGAYDAILLLATSSVATPSDLSGADEYVPRIEP